MCAPGFFGDAVNLKDCTSEFSHLLLIKNLFYSMNFFIIGCVCAAAGTEFCDSYSGKCVCHPNVVGEKCDRCLKDHYGFESGRGCEVNRKLKQLN